MCKQPNVQNISLLFHATVCQFSVNDTGGRGMEKKKIWQSVAWGNASGVLFDWVLLFFMSVFVDNVISFLWNKRIKHIKTRVIYIYKTRYIWNHSVMGYKENKEMNELNKWGYKELEYNTRNTCNISRNK